MTKEEEIRLQVAIACIQGVLEAKHGVIGEIVPSLAVEESLRIADEFVKQWDNDKYEERMRVQARTAEIVASGSPLEILRHDIIANSIKDIQDKLKKYYQKGTTILISGDHWEINPIINKTL